MITAVIVEDEKVIREGLEKHIPWAQLEVNRIYSAEHAEQAFEICDRIKPDIIISDIRMPGMDGIELCRKLRESYPDSQIIFVTGFSDKEYLKAAIQLHAVSYVEKPVNTKELSDAVINAVNQIRKSRTHEHAVMYSAFTNSDKIGYVWTKDVYFSVGLLYFKCRERGEEQTLQLENAIGCAVRNQGLNTSVETVDERTTAFLFSDELPMRERFYRMKDTVDNVIRNAGIPCFFALGKEITGHESIKESYQSAVLIKESVSFRGWNVFAMEETEFGTVSELKLDNRWIDCFVQAVSKKDINGAVDIIQEISQKLKEYQVLMDMDVKYLYYSMETVLMRFYGGYQIHNSQEHEMIESAETIDELQEYVCGMLKSWGNQDEENQNSYIVQKVSDYILEHFDEKNLSIKILADQVYVTPTYLSNLYKKCTGLTIGQRLVDVRMEHAVRLLEDPQWKLYQIASMVGYEDPNYFAKIFKKKVGITPSEYREKLVMR